MPLDLYALVQRNRRLTPELVLGWRAVSYVREFFCQLDPLRIAVAAGGDLKAALVLTMTENRFPLSVLPVPDAATWHVLAYHGGTGTALEMAFNDARTAMDAVGQSMVEACVAGDPIAGAAYSASLDRQVLRLMDEPLEALCRIRERIIVPSRAGSGNDTTRCRRCGRVIASREVWHADGVPCCPPCTGLPADWIVRQ